MSRVRQLLLSLGLTFGLVTGASAATLLPNGEQTFVDANGQPLASGTVQFDIPSTTTPKTTWVDPGQAVANANPVVLDSAGRAIIYGSGSYRQIVKDQFGNLVWDQLTADSSAGGAVWGGTTTGSANAPSLTAGTFTGGTGQQLNWLNGFTNTGAVTLTVNGVAYALSKDTPSGPVALTGGELASTDISQALYDGTTLHLVTSNLGNQLTTLASATTTDLGTVPSHNVSVTGTATVTSFGSSANTDYPRYDLVFTGAATLTYNASSLILPTAANIPTAAGDSAVAQYLGSGNWRVRSYTRADGTPLRLASGSAGTTGAIPYYSAPGVVALLPAGTNGQGLLLSGGLPAWTNVTASNYQSFTASGTWTKPVGITSNSITLARCWAAGGGGGSNATGGGGGGGGFTQQEFPTSDNSPKTVTITVASPAVVTYTNTFANGQTIQFQTTGALPSGITAGINYYVISAGLTASTFRFSATVGGAAINTTGSQSGVQTITTGLGATEAVTVGTSAVATIGGDSSFGNWLIAGGGGAAGSGAGSGGGGGGGNGSGSTGNNASTTTGGGGGGILAGAAGAIGFWGGGGGGNGSTGATSPGFASGFGGGGGGGGNTAGNGGVGGQSIYGGGGGGGGASGSAGTGGGSVYGGNGGASTVVGQPPGGGGGRNAAGAAGECDIWTSG